MTLKETKLRTVIDKVKRYLRVALLAVLSLAIVHKTIKYLAVRGTFSIKDCEVVDVVFVTPPAKESGWILEAICREIGKRFENHTIRYCHSGERLPRARCYFFSHYMFYVQALSVSYAPYLGRCFIYATHLELSKHRIGNQVLARCLSRSEGVICMNSGLKETLAAFGVPNNKLTVAVGAASLDQFMSHKRNSDGKVGFCTAYYPRKSPDTILGIIRLMPHRSFILIGKGWEHYPQFDELVAAQNFEYVQTEYANYADYYKQMSVFVSVSQIEGGPIPLIEAMMSNAVPVASQTGFAPDIINHGVNGFLVEVNAPAVQYCELIEKAFELQTDVREFVLFCDWNVFAHKIEAFMGLSLETSKAKSGV